MLRRDFIKTSLGALGFVAFAPLPSIAKTPMEGWLSGFKDDAGRYGVAHIGRDLQSRVLFYTDLRLHGLAKHPTRPVIVAPARRPDRKMFVFDMDRRSVTVIDAAQGRHFYGHGVFSADGKIFYTSESAYDDEKGVIGLYDVGNGFARIGEWNSGGIGPHEMRRFENRLIVANGGILTHPDLGRSKLNLDDMAPNLTVFNLPTGAIERQFVLPERLHQLSIRHIDVDEKATVYIGLQDQIKGRHDLALVWRTEGSELVALEEPEAGWSAFKGYVGSVSAHKGQLCVSSPRGNCLHIWGAENKFVKEADVCGIAPDIKGGFLQTSGQGIISDARGRSVKVALHFDNHCLAV